MAGDNVTVEFGVIEPVNAEPLQHIALACALPPGLPTSGVNCAMAIGGSGTTSTPIAPLQFTMPNADVLVFVATCDAGARVTFNPTAAVPVDCIDANGASVEAARADLATFTVRRAPTLPGLARDPNRQVTLSSEGYTLDNAVWPEGDDCTDPALPHLVVTERSDSRGMPAGSDVTIRFTWPEAQRESYPRYRCNPATPALAPETEIETLQFSHYVTLGELSRAYSIVDGPTGTTRTPIELTWTTPTYGDTPAGVTRVDMFFALRDVDPNCGTRGGFDLIRRSLCIERQ